MDSGVNPRRRRFSISLSVARARPPSPAAIRRPTAVLRTADMVATLVFMPEARWTILRNRSAMVLLIVGSFLRSVSQEDVEGLGYHRAPVHDVVEALRACLKCVPASRVLSSVE